MTFRDKKRFSVPLGQELIFELRNRSKIFKINVFILTDRETMFMQQGATVI